MEIPEVQPEWLAHHYMEAALVECAAEYWLRAGQRARDAYANREAASHLQKCLDAIESRPQGHVGSALEEQKLRALVLLDERPLVEGGHGHRREWSAGGSYRQVRLARAAAA